MPNSLKIPTKSKNQLTSWSLVLFLLISFLFSSSFLNVSFVGNQGEFVLYRIFQSKAYAANLDIPELTDWHIQLSAYMPSVGLEDSMNTIGIAQESSPRMDKFDIPDQPRPPWSKNYLDLVFPHPEWGGDLTDYSSDFRPVALEEKIETWHFEVRSNIKNEEIIFSWHGPVSILERCRLRDGKSGEILVSNPVEDGYSFIMTAPVHEFVWEYNY